MRPVKSKLFVFTLILIMLLVAIIVTFAYGYNLYFRKPMAKKPVIYLYPTHTQNVSVKLEFKGKLTCSYPEYIDGWKLNAEPDGTLTNLEDHRTYSYLFWEGKSDKYAWDLSKGYVVRGSNTREFLQDLLSQMGLTPKEYNDFIVYWLPLMQDNKYNLIAFPLKEYEEQAKLTVEPAPDSILRIFMVFKSLNEPIKVQEPRIEPFERKGFTVVEWGGTQLE